MPPRSPTPTWRSCARGTAPTAPKRQLHRPLPGRTLGRRRLVEALGAWKETIDMSRRPRGRSIAALLLACLSVGILPAQADPTAGAVSPNVEHIAHVPFDAGTATGLRIVGKHMYVTSWRHFSIYDISAPTTPELLSTTPFGFQYENE